MTTQDNPDTTLDPEDWDTFRKRAHAMLDHAIDKMEGAREGRVWTPVPDALKARLQEPLPPTGAPGMRVDEAIRSLMPYGPGNTHPRFFGWVHGSGTPSNMIAEIAAAAMNVNAGGRDQVALYVERQLVQWVRQLFGFPETASGLTVSGTSMATILALKAARDVALDFRSREQGVSGSQLVAYASAETHACVARAFDMLGLGSDALRRIPTDDALRMSTDALETAIGEDRAAGRQPFALVGTAGTVNTGAIDPLIALADIATEHGLWFHIDAAFGASGMLSPVLRPRFSGLERAHSVAFDFHKWMHVNYDAGFVLIRDEEAHRRAFSMRPDYLQHNERGLAAGFPWAVDYGPELSRGFRALKVWAHLMEHGPEKIGASVTRNVEQVRYLAERVDEAQELERLAPVETSICCFRHTAWEGASGAEIDRLNDEIVVRLQEEGIAAPSTTRIGGKLAIRVNITNHRTQLSDVDMLLEEIRRCGRDLSRGNQR
ncbi:MAG: pyridoxal-dependent decarboxylase [Henriciella sp.]|uniref:pyridoxal phosphate-dependent decarboxylase family protein n=1 Tax=Henriciella sp. TaxID=1968823 RepID=UPI0032EF02B4